MIKVQVELKLIDTIHPIQNIEFLIGSMPDIDILDGHHLLFEEFGIEHPHQLEFAVLFVHLINRQAIIILRHQYIVRALNPLHVSHHPPILIMILYHRVVSFL